jgi:hypothetical protein
MGGNVYYTCITIKEIIFIHAYVTGKEIPSSQALQILGQFDPKKSQVQLEKHVGIVYEIMEKNCSNTIDRNIRNYLRNKDYARTKS